MNRCFSKSEIGAKLTFQKENAHVESSSSCYEAIAAEYYDPRHITSRNFEVATQAFMKHFQCNIPEEGLVLDLGAGRGNAKRYCGVPAARIVQLDKSPTMITQRPRELCQARAVSDALSLPFKDEVFCAVLAFLYDSFNVPKLYSELRRVLVQGGIFLGTLPHIHWGRALRSLRGYPIKEAHLTDRFGRVVVKASLLLEASELKKILEEAKFNAIETHAIFMPKANEVISRDLIDPAAALGMTPYELPFLLAVRARSKS